MRSYFRVFLTSSVFVFGTVILVAQNLVLNPGFEELKKCPEDFGTLSKDASFWKQPTSGSTDYFNNCSEKMSVNSNFIGEQDTFEGNAYAGLYVYGPNDYREYLAGELKQKLIKGKKYNFSFQVSLADKSEYAIKEFGILFLNKELDLQTKSNIPYSLMNSRGRNNYVGLTNPRYYTDKENWTEVSGSFVAFGTEKYIVLGNFRSNAHTKPNKIGNSSKKAAYYYIDMVVVEEAEKSFKLDEIYVFENLLFEVDGFNIQTEGQKQLESIVVHLKDNPSLNISIYGHTDNVGSQVYNQELSKKRAKAVGLFLVDNGLSPFRIAWKGFGDMSPLAKNETKEGRDKNRRVEFIISKKKRDTYASGLFEDED